MALGYTKNFAMSTILFEDGTGVALTHTADAEQGNLSVSGVVPGGRNAVVVQRKGAVCSVAYTDRKFPQMTLSFYVARFLATSGGTITDFIQGTATTPYAARLSTLNPTGGAFDKVPFACNITVTIEGTSYGDADDETFTMVDCLITDSGWSESEANTYTITADVLGAMTGDWPMTIATK